ncbi:MAG: ribonuclease Z [Bacteroidaceae bacterium]
MEPFQVHFLGCGAAQPTTIHRPASQVVNFRNKLFMIDCGEGTQLQFKKSHLKASRLNQIFISHLHADHCIGLVGMLATQNLMNRTAQVHIYSPAGLERLMRPQLDFFCSPSSFEVIFHEFSTKESAVIYEDRSLRVTTIPLKHRMPVCGFRFDELSISRHINPQMCAFHDVPRYYYSRLRNGEDYETPEGKIIPVEQLTTDSRKARSYAYVSDTSYLPKIVPLIMGVDVLYHESTFSDEFKIRAQKVYHSTARQAANIARNAKVGLLVLGHYSARHHNKEEVLLNEAREEFQNTILGWENSYVDIAKKTMLFTFKQKQIETTPSELLSKLEPPKSYTNSVNDNEPDNS